MLLNPHTENDIHVRACCSGNENPGQGRKNSEKQNQERYNGGRNNLLGIHATTHTEHNTEHVEFPFWIKCSWIEYDQIPFYKKAGLPFGSTSPTNRGLISFCPSFGAARKDAPRLDIYISWCRWGASSLQSSFSVFMQPFDIQFTVALWSLHPSSYCYLLLIFWNRVV